MKKYYLKVLIFNDFLVYILGIHIDGCKILLNIDFQLEGFFDYLNNTKFQIEDNDGKIYSKQEMINIIEQNQDKKSLFEYYKDIPEAFEKLIKDLDGYEYYPL